VVADSIEDEVDWLVWYSSQELLQELNEGCAVQRVGERVDEARRFGTLDCAERFDTAPARGREDFGPLSAGCPGSDRRTLLAEPDFVAEEDCGTALRGVFFSRGQRALSHCQRAFGSAFDSFLLGFWQDRPIL
jgi:hypothetical protein